jgi:hypothetical protein
LLAISAERYAPKASIAIAAAAVGQQDRAIELMNEACDEREPVLVIYARQFPDMRRLYDDPRFGEVRRRLGLPHAEPEPPPFPPRHRSG